MAGKETGCAGGETPVPNGKYTQTLVSEAPHLTGRTLAGWHSGQCAQARELLFKIRIYHTLLLGGSELVPVLKMLK